MKSFARKALAALALALALAFMGGSAEARTYIVGIASDCVPSTAAVSERLMHAFLHLRLGDQLAVYDAPRRTVIAKIVIPADRPVFERPAVRTQQFGAELQKIRAFLEARCSATSVPQGSGNVRFPEFAEELSRTAIPGLSAGGVSVAVVGSALYQDGRNAAVSMVNGRYPSDASLNARRAESVYSLENRREALAGVDVHYCYSDDDRSFGDAYRHAVHRFWSLFVSGQRGTLATFTNDLGTCFERFERAITAGAPTFEADTHDSRAQMLAAKPTERAPSPSASVDFMREGAPISRERPKGTRGPAKIGIRWSCPGADLDLYARANQTSPFLYYGNRNMPDGQFPHDYQVAPAGDAAFEFVEFTRPVDLGSMQAFINFFRGNCPSGPNGIVRLWFDNKIYEAPFVLTATRGNGGEGRDGPAIGPHWAAIDIKKLANLK